MEDVTFANAQVVVVATIASLEPGMMTMSLPPQCHYTVALAGAEVLRGALPAGPLKLIVVGDDKPATGKPVALCGNYIEEFFAFTCLSENVEQAKASM
ncbi:hypothetical protein SS50377_26186 [Spironucleus salmonicida]|uniref:Uncharacterized protein n=1 Tax=Spironucleus salmonicida TaxID=348837 RepID=V6LVR6_9EUKA|nr:hypothetical protein SS50377_26181 [Spironucleus salmonicida]KAH0571986.1 hypothetical protein SS50377_26186 [Spironucleus salmonicida]|eukprot:EST44914.1 Hypothetical protein SS50377_15208 [Spironucleus salmonicida]